MVDRQNYKKWVAAALKYYNGKATILEVAKFIWEKHQADLIKDDEDLYKWQYKFRWAAKELREDHVMKKLKTHPEEFGN